MKAPTFWWKARPSLSARLLELPGWIYGTVTARRMSRPGQTLAVPVLCVGNLVAGGAGKTPTAIALAQILQAKGETVAFLSRGYGAKLPRDGQPIAVDPAHHGAAEVGDEPLLLARAAPTFVSRDRSASGERAIASGASVLILDDGLQNPTPRKSVAIAVVDGRLGVGNGFCLPAGPLRAPLEAQWPHVDALCVIGPGEAGARVAGLARDRGLAVWTARLQPDGATVDRLKGGTLHAFAGIGDPAKFFRTLESCGLRVVAKRAFPDHHRFTATEVSALRTAATRDGALLLTTEKDRVRLPQEFPAEVLPVAIVFDEPDRLATWLVARLRPARP